MAAQAAPAAPASPAAARPVVLRGHVSHGIGAMLLRLVAVTAVCVLVLYAVIETSLRLAWPEWAFWLAVVPVLLGMAVVIFASMWQSGVLTATESGVEVTYTRFPGGARRVAWPWADVQGYRFDTDPQGRPYLHVTPRRGRGVSVYGATGPAFETAFRALADAPHGGASGGIVEEASFYARPAVRWGSLVLAAAAAALTVGLTHSDHPDAWRSLWILAIAFAFAARAWF